MFLKYPSLETTPFTIYIQLWKDQGETDFYYVGVCPQLNLNITADSQEEAVEDMKVVIRDIVANKTEQELLGYGIKLLDGVSVNDLIFEVKASSYNEVLA